MKVKTFALGTLVLSLSVGCGQKTATHLDRQLTDSETASFRKAVPVVARDQLVAITGATNELSLEVLREAIREDPHANLILSPLSLAQDFTLVHESSKGETKKLVAKLLNVQGMSSDTLAAFHAGLLDDIDNDPDRTLSMANAIWIRAALPVDGNFYKKLDALFGCSVQAFPESLDKAKSEMDTWVSDRTRGMIKEIQTELTSETYAVFLNALYFDGKWTLEFDPALTEPGPFVTSKGTVQTPMMFQSEMDIRSYLKDNEPGVALRFLGGRYSFVAIVPPDPASFQKLVKKMDSKWFQRYMDRLDTGEVDVTLPKLDLKTTVHLESTIEKLGGGALFQPGLDLSVLLPTQARYKDEFSIQSVIQQAKLTLDEKGVKAAVVTEIESTAPIAMEPHSITFDRPFLYFIVHDSTSTIVLCGVVNDPTKS